MKVLLLPGECNQKLLGVLRAFFIREEFGFIINALARKLSEEGVGLKQDADADILLATNRTILSNMMRYVRNDSLNQLVSLINHDQVSMDLSVPISVVGDLVRDVCIISPNEEDLVIIEYKLITTIRRIVREASRTHPEEFKVALFSTIDSMLTYVPKDVHCGYRFEFTPRLTPMLLYSPL